MSGNLVTMDGEAVLRARVEGRGWRRGGIGIEIETDDQFNERQICSLPAGKYSLGNDTRENDGRRKLAEASDCVLVRSVCCTATSKFSNNRSDKLNLREDKFDYFGDHCQVGQRVFLLFKDCQTNLMKTFKHRRKQFRQDQEQPRNQLIKPKTLKAGNQGRRSSPFISGSLNRRGTSMARFRTQLTAISLLLIVASSAWTIISNGGLVAGEQTQKSSQTTAVAPKQQQQVEPATIEQTQHWSDQALNPIHPEQQQAIFSKKSTSSSDPVDSANLPAEFRGLDSLDEQTLGGDQEPAKAATGEKAKHEQSKLAKLCQQTSNVLASVLPAPFGGHKRSVLCQFFGHVPFNLNLANSKNAPARLVPSQPHLGESLAQSSNQPMKQQQQQHQQASVSVLHQFNDQQNPITFMSSGRHPIEIVMEQHLQQQRNKAMAFQQQQPAQQQMQQLMSNLGGAAGSGQDLKSAASIIDYAYQQRLEPPKSMLGQLQQRNQRPIIKQQLGSTIGIGSSAQSSIDRFRFSKPTTDDSFKPISIAPYNYNPTQASRNAKQTIPQAITDLDESNAATGWRIFNHELEPFVSIGQQQQEQLSLTTANSTIAESPNKTLNEKQMKKISGQQPRQQDTNVTISTIGTSDRIEEDSSKLLVIMGKPPALDQHQLVTSINEPESQLKQSSNIAKRTEALKSTTVQRVESANSGASSTTTSNTAAPPIATTTDSSVRTIEVIAQENSSTFLLDQSAGREGKSSPPSSRPNVLSSLVDQTSNNKAISSTTQRPPVTDPKQVQKREELVIASINNLTRIAFGNQLRDTVKVINKLIDQQAILFNNNNNNNGSQSKSHWPTNSAGDHMQMSESKLIGSKSTNGGGGSGGSEKIGKEMKHSRQKQIAPSAREQNQAINSLNNKRSKSIKKQQQHRQQTNDSTTRKDNRITSLKITLRDAKPTSKMPSSIGQKWTVPTSERPRKASVYPFSKATMVVSTGGGHSMSPTFSDGTNFKRTTNPTLFEYEPINTASTVFDIQRVSNSDTMNSKSNWPTTSRATSSSPKFFEQAHPRTETIELATSRYPWLLSSKSNPSLAYRSDLFGSSTNSLFSSKREDPLLADASTSSRSSTSYTGQTRPILGGKFRGKQALMLNRLDSQDSKQIDSLTTLKMSLANQLQQQQTTQSRWIPTSITRAPAVVSSTTTPAPRIEASTTTESPTTETSSSSNELKLAENSNSTQEVELEKTISPIASELSGELRASESINKFTTSHFNDLSNESLFSTTRRQSMANQQQTLPQIVQTGEFFDAETISTWPERYQTMLDGSTGPIRTTPSFETTRRNGESYELTTKHNSGARAAPASAEQQASATTRSFFNNLSSITILPANHKLLSANKRMEKSNSEEKSTESSSTTTMAPTGGPEVVKSTQVTYTIIGPQTSHQGLDTTLSEHQVQETLSTTSAKFPIILSDLSPVTMYSDNNSKDDSGNSKSSSPSSLNNLMRQPPYQSSESNSYLEPDRMIDEELGQHNQMRPYLSRKFHELFNSNNNRAYQNPLSLQRFNLSALKFLAQNLISANNRNTSNYNQTVQSALNSYANNSNTSETFEQKWQPQHGSLLELLNISLPTVYYDDLLNFNETGSSPNQPEHTTNNSRFSIGAENSQSSSKRILDNRKAAALLAAVRYQVPPPLIRPWDVATDSHQQFIRIGHGAEQNRLSDRFDSQDLEQERTQDSFLVSQLKDTIKSLLNKQRLVPKAELEARLNGNKRLKSFTARAADKFGAERRSADQVETVASYDPFPVASNSTNNESDSIKKSNHSQTAMGGRVAGEPSNQDFDLIDLSNVGTLGGNVESMVSILDSLRNKRTQDDYIQLLTSNGTEESISHLKSGNLSTSHSAKYHILAPNENERNRFAAALTRSNKSFQLEEEEDINIDDTDSKGLKQSGSKKNFDCSERQSGFYPDSETACQTFYHCSNTGHLLTFNCPQRTRFDKKSLKCGPWFEVPCDLGKTVRVL